MNPAKHLRDHPRCELCAVEGIASVSTSVGLVETGHRDTFTLAAVCRVHRTMLVAAYIAAGDDDPDDSGSGPGDDPDPDGYPDLSPGSAIVGRAS